MKIKSLFLTWSFFFFVFCLLYANLIIWRQVKTTFRISNNRKHSQCTGNVRRNPPGTTRDAQGRTVERNTERTGTHERRHRESSRNGRVKVVRGGITHSDCKVNVRRNPPRTHAENARKKLRNPRKIHEEDVGTTQRNAQGTQGITDEKKH